MSVEIGVHAAQDMQEMMTFMLGAALPLLLLLLLMLLLLFHPLLLLLPLPRSVITSLVFFYVVFVACTAKSVGE